MATNAKMEIKGNMLTISIDLKGARTKSASGKTLLIGATSGAEAIENDIAPGLKVNLQAYVKNPDYVAS